MNTGIFLLILRFLLAAALYAFLGWALYSLWRALRSEALVSGMQNNPVLFFTVLTSSDHPLYQFSGPEIILGRNPTAHFSLKDQTISSRHARLSYHHNQWWVEDLQSRNGTFLNDERIYTSTVIISGDELRCGEVVLRISMSEAEATAQPDDPIML